MSHHTTEEGPNLSDDPLFEADAVVLEICFLA